jgi:uncharacterized NAD(P)/FAD-binding protein YdhS
LNAVHGELEFDIAIVGAGFAGVACAVALVRGNPALKIALLDPATVLPAGIPFAGAGAEHLLNVRADQMSIDSGQSLDFCDYFAAHESTDSKAVGDQFAPRKIYCAYVRDRLTHAQAQASAAGGAVSHLPILVQEIIKVAPNYRLTGLHVALAGGVTLSAPRVILALGAGQYKAQIQHSRWHVGPWQLAQLPVHSQTDTALIIGTGLTAVDSAQTLHRLGWQGGIEMLSPRAQVPAANLLRAVDIWQLADEFAEQSASPRLFLKNLRAELARAKARCVDWRSVLNALRPITARIFASWQPAQRVSMLRRAGSIWGTHRHRMPPQVSQLIIALQAAGKLKRRRGQFLRVTAMSDTQLRVEIGTQTGRETQSYPLVIDARGPSYHVHDWPLLSVLIDAHLVKPSATGFGLLVDHDGRVGRQIYTLGVLSYGERLETMAVPEIRQQAERIADLILAAPHMPNFSPREKDEPTT